MLNLNAAPSSVARDQSDMYKVLVMDKFCRDIVAPLLRLNELRKHGITLHLALEAERQPIPDVPAIYFVQPTAANMDLIVLDASRGLYQSMHLNFVSSVPGRLMEQLASGLVKAGASGQVHTRNCFVFGTLIL